MPGVIRAALFDFGGVIVDGPFEAFAAYEREHGLPDGLIRRINATDPDTNAWAHLERGEVDAAGFATRFEAEARALGQVVDGRAVLALLSGSTTGDAGATTGDGQAAMGRLRPAMVEAVRRCSTRLVTGLLTNNFVPVNAPSLAGPTLVDPVPVEARSGHRGSAAGSGVFHGAAGGYAEVLALFDGIIESSRVGVRKPDPRFYEIACSVLEIEPAEAVFLDDLGINLKPARAMGMLTIKVGDPAVALAELEQVVGFPLA
jgi:putative hydrolase of the HAD superfamily